MLNLALVIIVSYLIGAIPFSLIFAKLIAGTDPRAHGTRNVGASNVLITTGKKRIAILAGFFDLLKGFAVVIAAKIIFGADIYYYLAGFFAVVGHDFPAYIGFRGGKGVATTAGALIAINPFAIWFCLIVYVVSFGISKYLILSSLLSILMVPIVLWGLGEGVCGLMFGVCVFMLALFAHREDVKRLLSGQETKFTEAASNLV